MEHVYRPKYYPLYLIGYVFSLLLLTTMILAIIRDVSINGTSKDLGAIVLTLTLFSLGIVVVVMHMRYYSPVVLDEHGLSKTLIGIKWRTLHWDNIKKIHSFTIKIYNRWRSQQLKGSVTNRNHYQLSPTPLVRL